MQLGSDLTLMMLIEVEPTHSAALHVALAEHQRTMRDLHLITRTTSAADATRTALPGDMAQRASRFQLAAMDRPGLVHLVSSAYGCGALHTAAFALRRARCCAQSF